MVNQCLNCGAGLRYDIASASLKCDHCDSFFSPDEYDRQTDATEEMTVFTCPNCGANITGNDEDAVDYCMYCGSFVTLRSHIAKLRTPDGIIPFKKTKDECISIYKRMIMRKLYAPKEFRDESFLKSFRGAYIPYWIYEASYGPDIHFYGSSSSQKGDYVVTQHYTIKADVEGEIGGIIYDASSSFDDSINASLAPYDSREVKPYNPAYMFGFFADTADVNEDLFLKDAEKAANDEAWRIVSSDKQVRAGHPNKPGTPEKFDTYFKPAVSSKLALLPVWFLTFRKGDRVAYSAVNGETGAIYSEVPIDPIRYILISLITAIPLFLLLNMNFTFLGPQMVAGTLLLSVLMVFLYMVQIENIIRRTFRADDRGFLSVHKKEEEFVKQKISSNILISGVKWLLDFMKFDKSEGIYGFLGAFAVVVFALSISVNVLAVVFIFVVPVYVLYRIVKCSKLLEDKTVYFDVAGAMIATVVCALTLIIDPASDYFYYGAAIVCILATTVTAALTIRRYNQLITRPIPRWEEVSE